MPVVPLLRQPWRPLSLLLRNGHMVAETVDTAAIATSVAVGPPAAGSWCSTVVAALADDRGTGSGAPDGHGDPLLPMLVVVAVVVVAVAAAASDWWGER